MDREAENVGRVYMVREVEPEVVAVVSNTAMMREEGMSECIEEVLQEWQCTWIWRLLKMQGNEGWLREAICNEMLIAVTHVSYIQEDFPISAWRPLYWSAAQVEVEL